MIVFLRTIFIVYLLAINVFGFMLILTDKRNNQSIDDETTDENKVKKNKISKSKLISTAFLGGALGIYLSLFILKYKTNNLFLMITMPLILAINVYILIFIFSNTFGIIVPRTV